MKTYIIYSGAEPVASDKDKKEAIRKAKAICPNRSMIGILRDMNTGKDSSGFYVTPVPFLGGCHKSI